MNKASQSPKYIKPRTIITDSNDTPNNILMRFE